MQWNGIMQLSTSYNMALTTWSLVATISFNKYISMQDGRSNTIQDPRYILGDCLLFNLTTAKDLEITIDNKLNCNIHISIITCRAHARAYLMRMCFISGNTQSLVRGS